MITIICVFNDQRSLELNLLKSIRTQNVNYELVLIDNCRNTSCLPVALNKGASKTKGDYLMFVHQDVELVGDSWLQKAEAVLDGIKDLGVAGIAGVDDSGCFHGYIADRGTLLGEPAMAPTKVMTVDEQLMIVPKRVFECLKIDEGYRWHSWAADYCLNVNLLGLRPYVVPMMVRHNSSSLPLLRTGKLETDDFRLMQKHKDRYRTIQKTTGTISADELEDRSVKTVPTMFAKILRYCANMLQNKRTDASYGYPDRYLDVGTLPIEQPLLKSVKSLRRSYSVGLADSKQYIHASKRLDVHSDYVLCALEYLPIQAKSVDLCILRSCLEYLPKSKGRKLFVDLERVTRRILLACPNNGLPLHPARKIFTSSWSVNDLNSRGFKVHGADLRLELRSSKIAAFLSIIQWFFPSLSARITAVKKAKH
jgi:glycosyltransferase involved in cell wall biosynthesis